MAVLGDLRTVLLCLASFFKGTAAQLTLSRDNSFRDYETMYNTRFTSLNMVLSFLLRGRGLSSRISEIRTECVLQSAVVALRPLFR